jgi:hypothetical protein
MVLEAAAVPLGEWIYGTRASCCYSNNQKDQSRILARANLGAAEGRPAMSDARFEEMLNAYTGACYAHAVGCGTIDEQQAARASLLAYYEERTAGIRVTARREDGGYWIADENDHESENATLILDEVPR